MRRLAALLYDGFLVAAIWMVLGFLLQRIVGTESNQLVDGVVQTDPLTRRDTVYPHGSQRAVASISGSGLRSGQTRGMIAWRIKVESVDGGPLIDFKQGVIRYLIAAWPAFFIFGLGYLWQSI